MESQRLQPQCTFVPVGEMDVEEILPIYNHYIRNTTHTFHINPLSRDEMERLVIFPNNRYKAFLIRDGGDLCGYCILSPYSHREAYEITAEVTIYLKPDRTRRGIGGQAVGFLERYAAKNGISVLLAVISGENKPSLRLFRRHGYKKCAHFKNIGRKFDRLLDVIICQKELGA